jgi:hypothetical protein
MDHHVRMIVFLAALACAITGQSAGPSPPLPSVNPPQAAGAQSVKPDAQARKVNAEERAVAALTELNVPLGRDPSGRVLWIEAAGGELTDEAMSHLPGLPMLDWLEVGGGKVTALGMAYLKGCTALRRLYIHDVSLTNDSLDWLAGLRLQALSLQRTGITGKGLQHLKATSSLTVLNLSENDIVDEDLSQVARCTGLEVLALQDTKVTGAGLARLKKMARLNVINLINCRIVDADLFHFHSMPNLRIVQAAGCNLSDQAVKELTDKLTMLAVFR